MVQQGDFKIEIVEAQSKIPFKEHHKDGKIFVEVEPEIEYYISTQKITSTSHHRTRLEIYIDGQKLDYHVDYKPLEIGTAPTYRGLRSVANGFRTYTALKFEKPRSTYNGGTRVMPGQLMGKIELIIYENIPTGGTRVSTAHQAKKTIGSGIDSELAQGSKRKKVLRSTEGTANFSGKHNSTAHKRSYKKGRLVDTITLNYCAAVGLIVAGVLPKPTDIYEHHRMVQKFTRVRRRVEPLPINSEDTIDLCHDDEDKNVKGENEDAKIKVKDEGEQREKKQRRISP